MNILSSHKISGVLFDIIHSAKKELVLVSPYVNLTYWKQLATALTAARDRGVKIDFYVRHEPGNVLSKEQAEALGITPHLVANLHAKFHYNETSGLVTSLNLLGVSNSNSIEIGCQLDSAK
jgi:phosphatidylserine/phosphatidylglycerophosphate/cardiolipin synthase-like enzyme